MYFHSEYFDEYVMVAPGSDYGIAMWSDLRKIKNLIFLDFVVNSTNKIQHLLHHVHFSFTANRFFSLPGQPLWRSTYSLNSIPFGDGKRRCVILTDISACRVDEKYLESLHECQNVTMVMVMVNVLASKMRLLKSRFASFDLLFSFDKADCERYGFIYYPTIYSEPEVGLDNFAYSDAFFIGSNKGNRRQKVELLYDEITKRGGKADFYLVGVKGKRNRVEGIHYNRSLPYREVLARSRATNCIVEIMGEGQSGITLRTMEAICLNKRLLTDNQSVKQLNYYSSGYIKSVDEFCSQDAVFAMDESPVVYKYKGDFSPIHLLERIDVEMDARKVVGI